MSKWDKLITRICNLSKDLRFDELRKGMVLKKTGRQYRQLLISPSVTDYWRGQ